MKDRVGISVVFVHVVLIALCCMGRGAVYTPKPAAQRIVVKTVKLKPKPQQYVAAAPIDVASQVSKPKPKPVKSKISKPAKVKPKPDTRRQDLLAQAMERMAKVGKTHKQKQTEQTSVPKPIKNLKMDSAFVAIESDRQVDDAGYQDLLAAYLRQNLKLPEFGDVKIKLTITREGVLEDMGIVFSRNQVNQTYIEKKMTGMQLPSFGKSFPGAKKHVFTITLTNE